ncbi:cytosolic acyl coenzyme A thioester hydrolase-like [Watersipora subatra]|uniref:cytosolic acyl coenzyme A thioester hydrolase-like n=1 Tax=Watersipora subatra TaxID=2589382 RepID=UPI00355BE669
MSSSGHQALVSHKVGLNGVTTVTKVLKITPTRNSHARAVSRDRSGRPSREVTGDSYLPEESWHMKGVLTSDDLGGANSSHRTVTLSKLSTVADAGANGRLGAGSLLRFIEETGTVVSTRYCNYTAGERSLHAGSLMEPVHCGMVYLEYFELLLSAYPGHLLTCVADIYYTASHAIEIKSVIWAEDLVSCSRRLVCKASGWHVAFNVENDWKLARIPKLYLEPRQEEEGSSRYEKYRENRKRFSSSTISHNTSEYDTNGLKKPAKSSQGKGGLSSVQHSELLLSQVAGLDDCGTHMYMRCGSVVEKMEVCACLVAKRHSRAHSVDVTCGYQFNFLELVPRGSLLFFFARLCFTSRRLMEVEVLVDIDVLAENSPETKRVAVGYFCFVGRDDNHRIIQIPTMKVQGTEEGERYAAGRSRFESMRKYLPHTETHISAEGESNLSTGNKLNPSSKLHS